MKNAVIIIIVLLLLAGTTNHLHAQEKSTTLALGLSMGVPLTTYFAGMSGLLPGIFLPSLLITPNLGHFYAGQWGRGILFTGLRTTVVLGTYVALISNARASYYNYIEEGIYESVGIAVIGLSLCGAVTLLDWAFVPSSVQKYNERFQIEPEINLQNGQYGLGFSYRF
jgi:hypothetical protein